MVWDVVRPDMERASAALGHLVAVPEKRKARDVRTGMHRVSQHDLRGIAVERRHLVVDPLQHIVADETIAFGRGRQDADAERFRQDQYVAGPRAAVRQHARGIHEAGDREAVDRLGAVDRVAAGDDRAGLIGLVVAAAEDFLDRFLIHLVRDAHDVERELRRSAHRVDV